MKEDAYAYWDSPIFKDGKSDWVVVIMRENGVEKKWSTKGGWFSKEDGDGFNDVYGGLMGLEDYKRCSKEKAYGLIEEYESAGLVEK